VENGRDNSSSEAHLQSLRTCKDPNLDPE